MATALTIPAPRSILFTATTPMNVAMWRPLFDRLRSDPRVRCVVTARHRARRFYAEIERARDPVGEALRGVEEIGDFRAHRRRFDLMVSPGYSFQGGRVGTRIQIFHGVSLKNYAVSERALAYDHLFLVGPYTRSKFVQSGLLEDDDPRFDEVGMPKLDRLLDGGLAREVAVRAFGLDPSREVVLYAPTRSGENGSSLDLYGDAVFDALSRTGAQVLVKLHDRSYLRWRRANRVDWESRLSDLERAGRMRVSWHYDCTPCLAAADLLITDLSSVGNEFLLLDRPIVYLDVPKHVAEIDRGERDRFGSQVSDLRSWGRSGGVVRSDPAELPSVIHEELARPGRLSAERRSLAARFFYNPGRAAAVAVRRILEILGLDAHPHAAEAERSDLQTKKS